MNQHVRLSKTIPKGQLDIRVKSASIQIYQTVATKLLWL